MMVIHGREGGVKNFLIVVITTTTTQRIVEESFVILLLVHVIIIINWKSIHVVVVIENRLVCDCC